jgi:1,4-dihydroxy-2-naphthoate polyprenyltransferase
MAIRCDRPSSPPLTVRAMDSALLERVSSYPHVVVSWIGDDGYPVQTRASFSRQGDELRLARTGLKIPSDREVNLVASHIRPQPGIGYDQRRYLSLWGRVRDAGDELAFRSVRTWGWDEEVTPFFEYVERSNRQARSYLSAVSAERGVEVKPRLSAVWTFLVATRLPFLTATFVPVLLGIAVAGHHGSFNFWLAALTLLAAAAVHIGLNVANDVFDELSGADDANYTPTQFSGGSRVIQRGLLSLKEMGFLSLGAYVVAIAIGLALVAITRSVELLAIGIFGVFISVFYTAPPLRFVYRGFGELTTGIGFGPVMVLGAYVVQTRALAVEPLVASVPVAILIALVLYVNEIPDRHSDASVGKRTLPVIFGREVVTRLYLVAALLTFATIIAAVALGVMPLPALLALLGAPLAWQVYGGIRKHYDKPYDLMAIMGKNVQLHLLVGLLLFAGYVIAIVT